MYKSGLDFLDAVMMLKDRINDLYSEEQITQKTYNRKKSFRHLVRAVNKADRMINGVRKTKETVALVIPADVHILPMDRHEVFTGPQVDSISESTLASEHPAAIDIFLNKEPWHEVHAIHSEVLTLYDEHPADSWTKGGQIRRVRMADFNASRPGVQCAAFDDENHILHLSESFSERKFMVFEARVIPAQLNVRDFEASTIAEARDTRLDNMQVKTQALHEDLLLDVAMSKLLPGQMERVTPAGIAGAMAGTDPKNGSTVYVPDGQYGGFGNSSA